MVPSDPVALQALPGVGPYTAAAVASLAFGRPIAALDTNVRRIVARVGHGREPDEVGAAALAHEAQIWLDRRDPGRWNEAVMDLGRERCRPTPDAKGARSVPGAGSPHRAGWAVGRVVHRVLSRAPPGRRAARCSRLSGRGARRPRSRSSFGERASVRTEWPPPSMPCSRTGSLSAPLPAGSGSLDDGCLLMAPGPA